MIEYETHPGSENSIKITCQKCGILFQATRGDENDEDLFQSELDQAQVVVGRHDPKHVVIVYQTLYL